MILAIIILALVVTFIGTVAGFCTEDRKYIGVFNLMLFLLNLINLINYVNRDNEVEDNTTEDIVVTDSIPSALDVYNGRTSLQITNVIENDSIVKSDTIVVFKK